MRVTTTDEIKTLFKSLGIDTKGLVKRINGNTFEYDRCSTWAYSFNVSTQTIEVNKTYYSTNKAIKRHNKIMYKKYVKFRLNGWFERLIDSQNKLKNNLPLNIHDKINLKVI